MHVWKYQRGNKRNSGQSIDLASNNNQHIDANINTLKVNYIDRSAAGIDLDRGHGHVVTLSILYSNAKAQLHEQVTDIARNQAAQLDGKFRPLAQIARNTAAYLDIAVGRKKLI